MSHSPDPPFRRADLLVPLAAVAVFLAWVLPGLATPGLEYDEVIFVNAALGGIEENYSYKRVFGIPTMIMPYIGALKSWLHAPVFALFGVDPMTIRLPSVGIVAAGLVATWWLCRATLGRWWAAVVALVLALDPALVFMAKTDYGPTALMFALKMAALVGLTAWLRNGRVGALWWTFIALALGLWDKLNFLWFVVAVTGATIAVFPGVVSRRLSPGTLSSFDPRMLWRHASREARATWIAVAAFVGYLGFIGFALILPAAGNAPAIMSPSERLASFPHLWSETMGGAAYYELVFGETAPYPRIHWPLLLGSVVLCLVGAGRSWRAPDVVAGRLGWLLLGMFVLILGFYAMTPQAGGTHHVLMLMPLHHLLLVAGAAQVDRSLLGTWLRPVWRVLCIVGVAALLAWQVVALTAWSARLAAGEPFSVKWAPEIYTLAEIVDEADADQIISLDWGIHTQLFSITEGSRDHRFADLWPAFTAVDDPKSRALRSHLYDHFFAGKRVLAITHGPRTMAFDQTTASFEHLCAVEHLDSVLLHEVPAADGTILYRVHLLDDRPRR